MSHHPDGNALRIVFAGTPDFAAESLEALLATRHHVVGVYTQPDRPAGRGRKLTPSPVKRLALEHDLPVEQPTSLKAAEAQRTLAAFEADVMIVVAYGLLLPQAVLDIPRLGCLNVHASLLPRWRGAAPIQRAIEAGDDETGITLMQMDAGLDTGDMLAIRRTPIDAETTGGSLHDRLAALGGETLVAGLEALAAGKLTPTRQPEEGVTYAHKLSKAEGALDFSQSAVALARRVRAFNPWPVAWTRLDDEPLRLWLAEAEMPANHATETLPGTLLEPAADALRVACGERGQEVLRITQLQLPGGKPLETRALLNAQGSRFEPGKRLDSEVNS
ncbi:methionyl-tRNA formyltransferase [Salinicola rhizosphaerae]|uniref:Methionyl-tRNA formyltransferase n=1 Tax=Salinicola rhizosphaerae TaxID=1443141 RepID=A0ABQ3E254_9GAMM|nr:methionyl-tRNA formyltransferase [Salinicola rhizosphaerae]GHB22489.1 methionyl-tRNA formyltransferase [Salinicola rhizosphaerae]